MNYTKVMFVCDYAANYGGNFLASLYALASRLRTQEKDILFIFPSSAESKHWEIDLSQFRVIYCDFDTKTLANAIRSNISTSDRVILHLHFITSLALLLDLKQYMRNRGLLVVHEHMTIQSSIKQRIKGFLLKTIGPKNIVYVGVSPAVYQQLCREVGKKRTRLVINAIDTSRLNPSVNHDNTNILMFGTHFERKGVDLAIAALLHSQIASRTTMQIVTHNIKEAQNKIIAHFGSIPSFVRVLPTSSDARRLYDNCFLFLSPSRSEAFGYAVVEAAYSGDRVIASDVPGQDTLEDIPGIAWIKRDNTRQLQNAIESAYFSHVRGKSGTLAKTQNYIRQHYSLEHWVDSILTIYNQA